MKYLNQLCIVRKSAIKYIQDMQVELDLPKTPRIPIGPNYWENVKKYMVDLF